MEITLSMIREHLIERGYSVSGLSGEDAELKELRFTTSADGHAAYIDRSDDDARLCCGEGSFVIYGIPVGAAYDATQEALCFYNDWETSLMRAAWNGADVQELIDIAEPVFQNPIFICTWQGRLLGYTKKYEKENIREFWSLLVREKQVPIFCLKHLRESPFYDVVAMENCSQLLSFSEYGYRCIMGMIHRDHEICLHYQIIEHNKRLTDTMVRLSQVFLFVLQKVVATENDASAYSTSQLLCAALDGEAIDSNGTAWVETSLGWASRGTQYQLLCFRQLETEGKKDKNYILGQLEIRLPLCKIVYWRDQTIAITKADTLRQSMHDVDRLCDALNAVCGVSLPFSEWMAIPHAYGQADLALSFLPSGVRLVKCADYAWAYLTEQICRETVASHLIHPDAKRLADYDAAHDTQLSDTLLAYLAYERNISAAAEKMFIHRNTMQYRLRKIFDLLNADLDDPNIRAYLSISIQALKRKGDRAGAAQF